MKVSTWLLVLLVSISWLSRSVWADIYADTPGGDDAMLFDLPVDDRFLPLVKPQHAQVEAVLEDEAVAPPAQDVAALANPYAAIVDRAASDHGMESALLHAVVSVESRYDPKAVSRAGAAGLMQLMPATARHYGVTDRFDPEQNMDGGAKYLKYLLKKFNSDISLALAAYNAGETAVYKYGNQIPPYRETTDYVQRVLDKYRLNQASL